MAVNEDTELPEAWRVYADTMGVRRVEHEWKRHVDWMEQRGRLVTDGSWKKWCDRARGARSELLNVSTPKRAPMDWKKVGSTPEEKAYTLANATELTEQLMAAWEHARRVVGHNYENWQHTPRPNPMACGACGSREHGNRACQGV